MLNQPLKIKFRREKNQNINREEEIKELYQLVADLSFHKEDEFKLITSRLSKFNCAASLGKIRREGERWI